MSDWTQGISKVKPGLKCYLFVGESGNALDELISRAIEGVDHVLTIRPPLSVIDLSVVMGMPEESQVIIIRDIEELSLYDVTLIGKYLKPNKVKGRSLLLVGSKMPSDAYLLRQATKQGLYVDVQDPTGELGRKHLVEWFADECKIMVVDAEQVCQQFSYSISALLWIRRAYLSLSSGKVLPRSQAQKLLVLSCPDTDLESAFTLLMKKDKSSVMELVRNFDYARTSALLHSLESALTDIALLTPHSSLSVKQMSDKSGLHIVRVLELEKYIPLYPASTIDRCRKVLDLGFSNVYQKESAATVALLWS